MGGVEVSTRAGARPAGGLNASPLASTKAPKDRCEMTNSEARVAEQKDWIRGATGNWEVVIGMEVHAQVLSKAKLFSGASAEFGGAPNDHVSIVDAAMPGMLPVINGFCVEQAVRTGLGLKARINRHSVFDRKNYFYPDLPQGYQISQYELPIITGGWLEIVSVTAGARPVATVIDLLVSSDVADVFEVRGLAPSRQRSPTISWK